MPLPYAEAGYGYPESGQSVVNATNGKIIRLLVADEPFDLRYGRLGSHERTLDLRAGTLTREVEWTSPDRGHRCKLRTTRLVSLAQRAIAAIEYIVEPVDKPLRIVRPVGAGRQRAAAARRERPARGDAPGGPRVRASRRPTSCARSSCTGRSRASCGWPPAIDHVIDVRAGPADGLAVRADFARTTFSAEIEPGSPLRLVKFIAYGWSARRSMPALRDQVSAGARRGQAHRLGATSSRLQREYLDEFWERADVEIDGEPRLQQALRFGMFHVRPVRARATRAARSRPRA